MSLYQRPFWSDDLRWIGAMFDEDSKNIRPRFGLPLPGSAATLANFKSVTPLLQGQPPTA